MYMLASRFGWIETKEKLSMNLEKWQQLLRPMEFNEVIHEATIDEKLPALIGNLNSHLEVWMDGFEEPWSVNMAEPNRHSVNSFYTPLGRESAKLERMKSLITLGRIVALKNTKINQLLMH